MRWPLLARKFITRFRLNCCLVGILAFISLKHVPVLFIYAGVEDPHSTNCATQPYAIAITADKVYRLFDFITHSIIGYSLMVLLNAILYSALRQYRALPEVNSTRILTSPRHPVPSSAHKTSAGVHRRGLAASRIILCLSVSQVISTIPYFILIELFGILKVNWLTPRNYLTLYYACVFTLFTNYVINYFVVLLISSRIRQISVEMFAGVRGRAFGAWRRLTLGTRSQRRIS
ncbi:hypothetical protein D915_000855 [Fasciola hepatica]|uniref:G-protein coupled receptors family 1 profile domain-containing protein n=1 Tax=Fasciola hepatica TaxID=6192 RepID=A0A4E0RZT9_FASHE|nr:hypothetical protein D915_000855 [Fasciola hepatica]